MTVHATATDRVLRTYDALRNSGPPRVTLDRAILFTESFKETEGQPLVLRWAKALKLFAEKVLVMIFDDELIVGRPNTWFGYWGIVYPELDGSQMPAGVDRRGVRHSQVVLAISLEPKRPQLSSPTAASRTAVPLCKSPIRSRAIPGDVER
jgi:hypothetical protein